MGPVPVALPWAVHISDGVLTWPWWVGGFALAAVLALAGAYRVRDEEIPRIALLTAAFFVASLIHVRAGPTSVHLVLNSLVGVLLGRRAALAIPLAVALQMVLLGHGGFTTIGVNACVMTLPALLAGSLFGLLRRVRWARHPWFRAGLVVAGALPWMLSLVFSMALISLNLSVPRAGQATFHPATLAAVGLLALLLARAERGLDNAPEFPLGLLVGVLAVLATSALNAAVLLWGGAEDWHTIALLVFVAHLPVVVIEGVVVGFTVGFLARVKPEMLGSYSTEKGEPRGARGARGKRRQKEGNHEEQAGSGEMPLSCFFSYPRVPRAPRGCNILLAVLGVLWAAGPAHAHRLEADCQVLPGGQVQIESWFDPGDGRPRGAKVQVFRPDGSLVAEGQTDDQGVFVFSCREAERLRVVVNAGAGHRKEFTILKEKLEQAAPLGTQPPPPSSHPSQVSIKDVLIGVGFLLALAAFVLSLRNARRLEELTRQRQEPPGQPRADEDR
jgi:cobalt/nickel transport system permease protein